MNTIPLIKNFFNTLNSRQVEYCHWKSNHLIETFLQGEGDLDILVAENSQEGFKEALAEFGFKEIVSPEWEQTPSVFHSYGFDEETGEIVHIHAYFKLFTGGNLIKNYHLPQAEGLLIENSSEFKGIKIPKRSPELLIFVIRKILECGSIPDFLFTYRETKVIEKELKWLCDRDTVTEAKALLPNYFPFLNEDLFDECIATLQSKPKFFRWVSLSKKLQKVFSSCSVNSPLKNNFLTWKKFFHVLYQKFILKKSAFNFQKGGAFIAFVGADASGKSTHIEKTKKWLHKLVSVKNIHSGKPPATLPTFFPRLFLPVFRKLLPSQRTNHIEFTSHNSDLSEKQKSHYSYFYLIRSIMIAYDQRALIRKARCLANKGDIIIADRHPSAALGGMDGRRVDPTFFENHSPAKRFLAVIEKRIYEDIPKPDMVFKLSAPLNIHLQRLAERGEKVDEEAEKIMESRKAVMGKWELPGALIHEIDNSAPLEEVQIKIRGLIWSSI